jgi:hypothetical protein
MAGTLRHLIGRTLTGLTDRQSEPISAFRWPVCGIRKIALLGGLAERGSLLGASPALSPTIWRRAERAAMVFTSDLGSCRSSLRITALLFRRAHFAWRHDQRRALSGGGARADLFINITLPG